MVWFWFCLILFWLILVWFCFGLGVFDFGFVWLGCNFNLVWFGFNFDLKWNGFSLVWNFLPDIFKNCKDFTCISSRFLEISFINLRDCSWKYNLFFLRGFSWKYNLLIKSFFHLVFMQEGTVVHRLKPKFYILWFIISGIHWTKKILRWKKTISNSIQVSPTLCTFSQTFPFKGTVSVISSDPQWKDDNARFTTVPLKPKLDKKNAHVTEKPQMKINSLKKQNHGYLFHT